MTIPNTNQKLNLGETSLVRVDYSQIALNTKNLSAPDRLGLIRDAFDLAQSGDAGTVAALELALSYKNEEDYTVWSTLTSHLSQLESLLAYEDFFDEFKVYGREIYQEIAKKMGWEKKPGEKHMDSLLRSIVLYKLGSFGDEETIKKAQSLFGKAVDPDLRGVVYNLVAENGNSKEWSTLVKMYTQAENQQEKDRLGRSLGLFKNEKLLEKTLEFAISNDVRFQNTLGIISSVWSNPKGRYLAWEFVKNNWKMLKERYAGGHYFTRVFQSAGDFTKMTDAKDIEEFIKKNPVPEAKRTIKQALEQIYSNTEWLKRDGQKIKEFFQKGQM